MPNDKRDVEADRAAWQAGLDAESIEATYLTRTEPAEARVAELEAALGAAYMLLQDLFDRWSCDEDSPREWGADLYERAYRLLESPVFKAIAKAKEAAKHA